MDTYNAIKIDSTYIYYKCDYCFRLNNKLVEDSKNKYSIPHNGYHIYNSDNNFDDRELRLKSHCLYSKQDWIKLIVNEKTLKIK